MKKTFLAVLAVMIASALAFIFFFSLLGQKEIFAHVNDLRAEQAREYISLLLTLGVMAIAGNFAVNRLIKKAQQARHQVTSVVMIALLAMVGFSSCATQTRATYAQIEGKLTAQQARRSFNYVAVKSALHQQRIDELYDSLNFKRLEGQAVIIDSIKGGSSVYVGQIMNLSKWSRVHVNIYALDENGTRKYPAIVSSFVAPGQTIEKALLPGRYFFTIHIKGKLEDQRTFPVSVQLYDIMGKDTHWYIIWDSTY